jgi:uncharacterized LabA/DUF88 family protein
MVHGGRFSALFADLENIYYYLKNSQIHHPEEVTTDLVRRTRAYLQEKYQEPCIIMIGYADFDRLDLSLSDLYLMGMEPRTVVNTEHKNSADMRLCIDVLEVLYTRPDIQTFVLIAGDRDYIPLVQHLQRQAKSVLIVSFRGNLSGDLLHIVGEANFIDASDLINLQVRQSFGERSVVPPPVQPSIRTPRPIEDADARRCLDILVNEYGDYHEVWLSPFFRRLNDAFPLLANHERKALVNQLVDAGAIRIEQREGHPYPFSVALINWNHPTVRELYQGPSQSPK